MSTVVRSRTFIYLAEFLYLTGLVAMMGSKVDFQGHPETRAPKTGVVTVSPLRLLSLSPFSRAIGESFLFLSSTLCLWAPDVLGFPTGGSARAGRFCPEPSQAGTFVGAQLNCQKGLPEAKPLTFQTKFPRWKSQQGSRRTVGGAHRAFLRPGRSNISEIPPMYSCACHRLSWFI